MHGPQPPAPRRSTRALVVVALTLAVSAIALWRWISAGARNEDAARPPAAASPQTQAAALVDQPEIPRPAATPVSPAQAPAAAGVTDQPARRRTGENRAAGRAENGRVGRCWRRFPRRYRPRRRPLRCTSPRSCAGGCRRHDAGANRPVSSTCHVSRHRSAAAPPRAGTCAGGGRRLEEMPPADGRVVSLAELPTSGPRAASEPARLGSRLVRGVVAAAPERRRPAPARGRRGGARREPSEITPTGAVFVLGGWRFKVPGGRP